MHWVHVPSALSLEQVCIHLPVLTSYPFSHLLQSPLALICKQLGITQLPFFNIYELSVQDEHVPSEL